MRRLLLALACVLIASAASAQTPTATAAAGCHYSTFIPAPGDAVEIFADTVGGEYPPLGTPDFDTNTQIYMQRDAGAYISLVGLRYDTSALPDDASIIRASLTSYMSCYDSNESESGRSLVAGWTGGESAWSGSDYAAASETTAFAGPLLVSETRDPPGCLGGPGCTVTQSVLTPSPNPVLYTVNLTLTGDDSSIDRLGYSALRWWVSGTADAGDEPGGNNDCTFDMTPFTAQDPTLEVYWCDAGVPTPVDTSTPTTAPTVTATGTATGTITETPTVTTTPTVTPPGFCVDDSDCPPGKSCIFDISYKVCINSTPTPVDTDTPVNTPVDTPTALPPIYETQSFYGTTTCPGLGDYTAIATGHVYSYPGQQQPEDQCVIEPPSDRRAQPAGDCVICRSTNTYDTFVEWGSSVCHSGPLGEYFPPVTEHGKQYQWKHLVTDGQCWKAQPDHGAGALAVVGSCAICSGAGPTFTVAGRSTCPGGATLVYAGKAYVGRAQQSSLQCWRSAPDRPSTVLGDCAVCALGTGPKPYQVWGTTSCPGDDTALVTGKGYQYGLGQLDSACWQQAPNVAATEIGSCAVCLGNGNDYVYTGAQTCQSPDTVLATGYVRTFSQRTHMRDACWIGAPTAVSTAQGFCALCEAADRVSTLYGVPASRGCPAASSEALEGFTYLCDEGANNSACWSTAPGLIPRRDGSFLPLGSRRSPCDQTVPCVMCRGVSAPW